MPIQVDLDVDSFKIRDAFVWNANGQLTSLVFCFEKVLNRILQNARSLPTLLPASSAMISIFHTLSPRRSPLRSRLKLASKRAWQKSLSEVQKTRNDMSKRI